MAPAGTQLKEDISREAVALWLQQNNIVGMKSAHSSRMAAKEQQHLDDSMGITVSGRKHKDENKRTSAAE